jgi:tryptophanyl-tRNA synthetase
MTDQTQRPRSRVLSGMRPTGKLHLGNYVGALQNWVKLQDSHECFFFVADWHALTTDYDDTSRLAGNTLEVVIDFLAAGLDPEKCTIFVQSHVLEHAELHVLFSMITPLGWLERVPSYKEQQQQMPNKDLHMYGFLGYPLLQAADILIYRPAFVPVGEDQVAHVELTREVARRFNQFYKSAGGGPVFPEPDALLTPSPKLLGTDKRKMSKSYGNTILLSDDSATVEEKIKNSVTDRPKLTDKGSPDRCPVGNLHQIFSDRRRLEYITHGCTNATITCVECKALAVESVNAHLEPIRQRRRNLVQHPERLREIIQHGAQKASQAAEATMAAVRAAVGVLSPQVPEPQVPQMQVTSPMDVKMTVSEHRDWWVQKIGRERYALRDVGHDTFVTRRNRRVALAAPVDVEQERWKFAVPDRHYDAIVFLCVPPPDSMRELADFAVPMSLIRDWGAFRRDGKKVVFEVRLRGNEYLLESDSGDPQDISGLSQFSFLE